MSMLWVDVPSVHLKAGHRTDLVNCWRNKNGDSLLLTLAMHYQNVAENVVEKVPTSAAPLWKYETSLRKDIVQMEMSLLDLPKATSILTGFNFELQPQTFIVLYQHPLNHHDDFERCNKRLLNFNKEKELKQKKMDKK